MSLVPQIVAAGKNQKRYDESEVVNFHDSLIDLCLINTNLIDDSLQLINSKLIKKQ